VDVTTTAVPLRAGSAHYTALGWAESDCTALVYNRAKGHEPAAAIASCSVAVACKGSVAIAAPRVTTSGRTTAAAAACRGARVGEGYV
jgi:hypothetical protein